MERLFQGRRGHVGIQMGTAQCRGREGTGKTVLQGQEGAHRA